MRIIIPSFCLVFALQVQASCFSRILSRLWPPGYVGYDGLRRAIDEGRLDIAVNLVKQDETLGQVGVRFVIGKDDPNLIASFVNQLGLVDRWTLKALLSESPIETVKKVLEKIDFPQQVLVRSATSYEGASRADKFLVLLDKIGKPEDQEKAVEKGIKKLVFLTTETSPLLNALKGKTFRSERLERLAIQKVFMEGVKSGNVYLLSDDICNHAAITPKLYADALIETALKKYNSMRQFLLKQADRYDLETVKEKASYADLEPEFRNAIEEALKTAAPGGTRTRTYDIQTVEKARETFEELRSSSISEDVFSIVADSVALGAPKRRKGQTVSTKAPEKVASDVLSTSTTKTESSKIRKRKRGKGKGDMGKGKGKGRK